MAAKWKKFGAEGAERKRNVMIEEEEIISSSSSEAPLSPMSKAKDDAARQRRQTLMARSAALPAACTRKSEPLEFHETLREYPFMNPGVTGSARAHSYSNNYL